MIRSVVLGLKQGFPFLFHNPLLCNSATAFQTRKPRILQEPSGTRCLSSLELSRPAGEDLPSRAIWFLLCYLQVSLNNLTRNATFWGPVLMLFIPFQYI